MSDVVAPAAPEAGWYEDPADASSMRWWDGSVWTDHIQPIDVPRTGEIDLPISGVQTTPGEPPLVITTSRYSDDELALYTGKSRAPTALMQTADRMMLNLPQKTYDVGSANTPAVWGLAFINVITFFGAVVVTLVTFGIQLPLTWATYLALYPVLFVITIILAVADTRALDQRGFVDRPSPFWTLLLPPVVYLILRAIKVRAQGGSSLGPGVAYVVCTLAVAGAMVAGAFGIGPRTTDLLGAAGLSTGSGSSSNIEISTIDSMVQTGLLSSTSEQWTVACSSKTPNIGPNVSFTCPATNGQGETASVLVKFDKSNNMTYKLTRTSTTAPAPAG